MTTSRAVGLVLVEVDVRATTLAHFSQGDEVYTPYSRATAVLLVLRGSFEVETPHTLQQPPNHTPPTASLPQTQREALPP